MEFAGIYPELSARDSEFVVDVLDLFRAITFSIERLRKDGAEVEDKLVRQLAFDGFDLNDNREGQMLSYARYLIDDGRWTELRHVFSEENDNGNSHARLAEVYQRDARRARANPIREDPRPRPSRLLPAHRGRAPAPRRRADPPRQPQVTSMRCARACSDTDRPIKDSNGDSS